MQPQGRYTILGEIASGGTATVFLAEDSVLRRKVALKKLHPHLLNRPDMVRRFQKEAVAVASLSHENVIKIFDYGEEGTGVFLAMEFVDGVSLESLVESAGGVIPNLAALSLFHQLLAGLAAAHAHGIFHRDIKPSNVLVDRKGRVRLADFGIAYLSGETSHTRTGAYLGTPGFSAPEQAEGKAVTDRTDIFSAGILLYRCLTGRMPFAAGSPHAVLKAIVEKTQPRANLVNPRLLPGLADLAGEMLAKHPVQRPDAKSCAARLESIAAAAGFAVEERRLRALLDAPAGIAEKEAGEIAGRFADLARGLDGMGKGREALRLYSLVVVFADKGSEAAKEAQRRLRKDARRVRVFAAAGVSLACGLLALWLLIRSDRPESASAPALPPAAPAASSLPAAPPPLSPASAPPVEWRRELALPTTVPAWDRPARNGRPAAPAKPHRSLPSLAAAPVAASLPAAPAAAAEAAAATAAETRPGFLWIKTTPPFAQVRIDGRESGRTPLEEPLSLGGGAHRLEVERAGCKPLAQEIRIAGGDTLMLRLTLERAEAVP